MELLADMSAADLKVRDQLIGDHQLFVENIARKLIRTIGLPIDLYDEIEAAGYLGLVEAASRYDASVGDFPAYASIRIRGAIIDSLRKNSQLTGAAYKRARALEAATDLGEDSLLLKQLTHRSKLKKGSRKERLAQVLEYAAKSALVFRLSMNDVEHKLPEDHRASNPEAILCAREEAQLCLSLIESLQEKERFVIDQYYFRGKSFIEIAHMTKKHSKSWVSRLHSRALFKIRQGYDRKHWGLKSAETEP